MGNSSWPGDAWRYFLLLLAVTSGLSNLPSVTCNMCNTKTIIPLIEISSSPPSRTLAIGAAVNLTCEAWPSDRDDAYDRRWTKYIQWYDAQDIPVGAKCLQSTPKVLKLQCTLMLKDLTLAQFGNYTCEAKNDYDGYCRRKSVEISLQDNQIIVEDPVNKSAVIGSNVTLNCTATGRPKPTIRWIKNNDSYAVQSNPRANVIPTPLDDKTIHSQLLITGMKKEDGGKYQCIAQNSAGEKTSKGAFLSIKDLAYPKSEPIPAPATKHRPISLMTVLSVSFGMIVALICGVSGVLLYRRAGPCRKGRRDENEICPASIPGAGCADGLPKDALAVDMTERTAPEGSEITQPPNVERKLIRRHPILERKDHVENVLDILSSYFSGKDCGSGDNHILVDQGVALDHGEQSDHVRTSQEIEEGSENDLESLEVLDEVLGEGEYGIVYKGRYGGKDGSITDVAVKKLKDTASTLGKTALLNEIRTLKQAGRHPNIVNLIGTWIQGETILIVTEFVGGGSLESLLKSKDGKNNEYANVCCKLNDRQLLTIAVQIALGMQHLEERKCIHRDLAARNVFIDTNMVAKVGDFGLARNISDDGLYIKTSSGKVPWRWSSLESLRDRVYTSMSDVWSFGILLWEIATYGKLPYPDITSPLTLVSWLSTGYRMPRPNQCSEELYTLMSSCWNENPLMRPTFADIAQQLNYFLREVKRTYINIKEDGITGKVEF